MKAELFESIAKYVQSDKMTIKQAVAKAQAQLGDQSTLGAVVKAYQREKTKRQTSGDMDLGHGNAMFTIEEEIVIIGAMLGFANERNGGSPVLAVDAIEAMGLLNRWIRAGKPNDHASLRERAREWA